MARHRRKVFVDANNHDRWIVSYADFITLLFAFFVVMYSMSSVNEGKYKSLTQSLGTAFSSKDKQLSQANPPLKAEPVLIKPPFIPLNIPFEAELTPQSLTIIEDEGKFAASPINSQDFTPDLPAETSDISGQRASPEPLALSFESIQPGRTLTAQAETSPDLSEIISEPEPAETQQTAKVGFDALMKLLSVPFESKGGDQPSMPETAERRELSAEILKERAHLSQVSNQLEHALAPFIDEKLVAVKRNDYWVELEMNSELLFLSGDAALALKARPVLKEIAQVISPLPNAIHVEGHTDNIPISNLKYPSNWELSSARATSVVQELVMAGIDPTRLSAIGYGEFHPIGDNTAEAGRFQNRRVTLVLMSQAFARYGTNDEERAKLLNLMPTTGQAQPSIRPP